MSWEVEAIYEGGVLRPDKPLPLDDRERVTVTVKPQEGRIRRSAGQIPRTGDAKALEYLLSPDNLPWGG